MRKTKSVVSPNLSQRRQVRKPAVRSRAGIVVTQNRAASEAGARALKAGGHAVDAVVAAAFAVGVLEPWMNGIGGVGGMLVYDARAGKVTGIDFGPRSPARLNPADFVLTDERDDGNLFGWPKVRGNLNTVGAKAVVAPTEPAGMAAAHARFGRLAWRDLVMPAAKLAEEGIVVDWHTTLVIANGMADLARDPGAQARFLPKGFPPVVPAAVDPEPLAIAYGGRSIHVLPELNGGPTLWVAFEDLKGRKRRPEPRPGAETFLAYAAALRAGWTDRFKRLGDAGERTAPTCTTHLCAIDRDGNMATLTQTLLSLFGARIVLPRTGILMNNGINWFDPVPGGPNSIAPGARPLANYVPAVMTGGGAATAIGGCGGRRILPAVFQLLAMSVDFGFDLDEAFHTPRLDVSGLDVVVADRRMPAEVIDALGTEFATVVAEPVDYPFPYTIAGAVRRAGGENEGATEPQHPWSEAVSEEEV